MINGVQCACSAVCVRRNESVIAATLACCHHFTPHVDAAVFHALRADTPRVTRHTAAITRHGIENRVTMACSHALSPPRYAIYERAWQLLLRVTRVRCRRHYFKERAPAEARTMPRAII